MGKNSWVVKGVVEGLWWKTNSHAPSYGPESNRSAKDSCFPLVVLSSFRTMQQLSICLGSTNKFITNKKRLWVSALVSSSNSVRSNILCSIADCPRCHLSDGRVTPLAQNSQTMAMEFGPVILQHMLRSLGLEGAMALSMSLPARSTSKNVATGLLAWSVHRGQERGPISCDRRAPHLLDLRRS